MEHIDWQKDSLDWVNYAYRGFVAPQLEVKGRMAMLLLLAVIWASAWYVPKSSIAGDQTAVVLTYAQQAVMADLLGPAYAQRCAR